MPRTRRAPATATGTYLTWTCSECNCMVHGPPLAKHCTVLDGSAAVRINTARQLPDETPELPLLPVL